MISKQYHLMKYFVNWNLRENFDSKMYDTNSLNIIKVLFKY